LSASETLTRIIAMVAELTLRERSGAPWITVAELAGSLGVTPKQVARDIETLTMLDDGADTEWLLSLRVMLEDDKVSIESSGQFQRPLRFTPTELLAVQMALITEGEVELAARLGGASSARAPARGSDRPPTIADRVSSAITDQRRLRCRYASDRLGEPKLRTIQPHQAVEYRNRVYVVAWCELSNGWRHFRLDRILEAEHEGTFEFRGDFTPLEATSEVFKAPQIEDVLVRYRDGAARWTRERYTSSKVAADERVLVRFQVANPEWLLRMVLEVGDEAEVVEPEDYRHAIRLALA
jgi:predicted DNA-binding transcriptional regulator YafY